METAFIGKVLSALPYQDIFGAPIHALVEAQAKATRSALEFILSVGFTTDDNGISRTRYAELEYTDTTSSTGSPRTQLLRVPLITLIHLPQVQVAEGEISFDIEVSQSATDTAHTDVEASMEGKVGWGPFSVSMKARVSHGRDSTRSTDTRAKQHVRLLLRPAPVPEGISLMLEALSNASTPLAKSDVQ